MTISCLKLMQLAAPQAALLVADRFNDHQLFEADVTACGCAPAWGQTSFNDHQLFEADVTPSTHVLIDLEYSFNDHQLFEADATGCSVTETMCLSRFNDHQLFEADVTASYHREESILPVSMTISCLKLM